MSVAADAVKDPLNESLSLGQVQPSGVFKTTEVIVRGGIKRLRFRERLYEGRPWLE